MWYKIVFKKNGNWSFSVFKYEDEAEQKTETKPDNDLLPF
jgi:hypothetical protein